MASLLSPENSKYARRNALLGGLLILTTILRSEPERIASPYFGDPIPGLSVHDTKRFDEGFLLFNKTWSAEEGLGPSFSGSSCVTCHRNPLPGGSGSRDDSFITILPDSPGPTGGSVHPRFTLSEVNLPHLGGGTQPSLRRSTALFGLGLIDKIAETEILALADPTDSDSDGISGRSVIFHKSIGKFGWKGKIPDMRSFIGIAAAVELGLENPTHSSNFSNNANARSEISAEQFEALAFYIDKLGPPPIKPPSPGANKGKEIFMRIGCASCHQPNFTIKGHQDKHTEIFPYSDFLLHDMGDKLSDHVKDPLVRPTEFRTAPLWGCSSTGPPYLHDGRAQNLREAILYHGGEALGSVDLFSSSSSDDQNFLIDFLRSL